MIWKTAVKNQSINQSINQTNRHQWLQARKVVIAKFSQEFISTFN